MRWNAGWLLGGWIALGGCAVSVGPTAQPVALAASPMPSESAAPQDPVETKSVGEVPAGKLQLAWVTETHGWNRIVAISPGGDVMSVGSGQLFVHARDTGKVLESTKVCFVRSRKALAFLSPDLAIITCTDGVLEVSLPGLASRMVVKTDGLAVSTAASSRHIAHGMRDGRVHVLETGQYGAVDQFEAGGEIEELVFSPDGRYLAVGRRDGAVLLRELGAGRLTLLHQGQRRATGLAFSRDGGRLFVNNDTFGARVLSLPDGTVIRQHRAGPWISSASDVGGGWFAAAGSEGLLIYGDGENGRKVEWDQSSSCEGLDAAEDGTLLCAGDRDGRVACFTTRALSASTYRAVDPQGPREPSTATPLQARGRIAERVGKTLRLQLTEGARPPASGEARLFRRFQGRLGVVDATGWLLVGRVGLSRVTGRTVTVELASEESRFRRDGSGAEQLRPGTEVKLTWEESKSANSEQPEP